MSTPTTLAEDKTKEIPSESIGDIGIIVVNKEKDDQSDAQATVADPNADDSLLDAATVKVETPQTKEKELCDDLDLDFEEISDGELDEEARVKGLGDALGVDWASLVEESKAITQERSKKIETSAKQRWQSHRILLDVGISFKMAGTHFAEAVLTDAQRKLAQETAAREAHAEPDDAKDVPIKMEIDEPTDDDDKELVKVKAETSTDLPKLHPVASAQVTYRSNAQQRCSLVFNATGPYSRALVAKRDIALRRQLCNLPIRENNFKPTAHRTTGIGYENIAMKLFKRALAPAN